jgi:hypothetical protein
MKLRTLPKPQAVLASGLSVPLPASANARKVARPGSAASWRLIGSLQANFEADVTVFGTK